MHRMHFEFPAGEPGQRIRQIGEYHLDCLAGIERLLSLQFNIQSQEGGRRVGLVRWVGIDGQNWHEATATIAGFLQQFAPGSCFRNIHCGGVICAFHDSARQPVDNDAARVAVFANQN